MLLCSLPIVGAALGFRNSDSTARALIAHAAEEVNRADKCVMEMHSTRVKGVGRYAFRELRSALKSKTD